MSEQYEWDQTGEPSTELLELENVMGSLRYEDALRVTLEKPTRRPWVAMAAAAAVLLVGATLWSLRDSDSPATAKNPCASEVSVGDPWSVKVLSGTPRCGERPMAASAAMPIGTAVETDRASRVRIQVADIGHVILEPNSRLALRATSAEEHRMQLEYGTLQAQIDAPPRLFLVETPAALAVDLGCEYTLKVNAEGETLLRVTHGYVSLENGHESIYVPAGYSSSAFPGVGSSVPYADDAPAELVQATHDLARAPNSKPALEALLRLSTKPQDTLGLWHLIGRSADACEAAITRLRVLTDRDPDPAGLGWGRCSDPDRQSAWQHVLEPFWEN